MCLPGSSGNMTVHFMKLAGLFGTCNTQIKLLA